MIRFNINSILIWKVNYCKVYAWTRLYSSQFSSNDIRQTFLNYFLIKNDHKFIRSSPVIPFCDPSVAFVNAGMNQFKTIFLGQQDSVYNKVANCQKCVRVGGKHNDINVVGSDGYHHTFFEMLGNWSFGDYFKREACEMAWNLLVKSYGLNPSALYITYFGGAPEMNLEPDLECKDIWKSIGILDDHIIPFGLSENFWEMGPVGPCGPCTEIHIDLTGLGNRFCDVNKGLPDLIELWNIVFIQYNRNRDGNVNLLPKQHIDTGMGLERLTAVLQNKRSNYDTDIFTYLFQCIQKKSKSLPVYQGNFGFDDVTSIDTSYRILADHARMVVACLADGMIPEQNQKLRRVIRKALSLSETTFRVEKGLLNELAYAVTEYLGDVYPEMKQKSSQVQQIISYEEEVYKNIRASASKEWQKILSKEPKLIDFNVIEMPGLISAYNEISSLNIKSISSQLAFKLYDTYGLDESTIKTLAQALDMQHDPENLKNELESVRHRTKQGYLPVDSLDKLAVELAKIGIEKTADAFKYNYHIINGSYVFDNVHVNVLSIIANSNITESVQPNVECYLILNQTNLYTEAGGQLCDKGVIEFSNEILFEVDEVQNVHGYIFHKGKFRNDNVLKVSAKGILTINQENRLKLMANHTATHLLNAALKKQVGVICQKSSKVTPDLLTFDVGVYSKKLSVEDIENVENMVRQVIRDSVEVNIREVNSQELLKLDNVTLIPGEVYPDIGIRLIEIEAKDLFSREPCCGTHVLNTNHIQEISIIGFRSLGRSTTSFLAITGDRAVQACKNGEKLLTDILNFQATVKNSVEDVDVLNNLLIKLRHKLTSKMEDDYILPVHVKSKCTKILNDLSRQLRDLERHSLKQFIDMEMKSVLETSCNKTSKNNSYLVHFLGCSSILDNIPLQRATKICSNIPVLVISYSDDVVKARCCVPENMLNSNFDAELWLTKTVGYVFKSSFSAPKGQNTQLVCNMKPKRVNKIEWDQLLEEALKSAKIYADTYL